VPAHVCDDWLVLGTQSSLVSAERDMRTGRPPVPCAPPLDWVTAFADLYRFSEFARSFRDAGARDPRLHRWLAT
jgi:hypothetical protein